MLNSSASSYPPPQWTAPWNGVENSNVTADFITHFFSTFLAAATSTSDMASNCLTKSIIDEQFQYCIRRLGGLVGSELMDFIQNCTNRDFILRSWDYGSISRAVTQAGIHFENAEMVSIMVGADGARIKAFSNYYGTTIFTPTKTDLPVFIMQGGIPEVLSAALKLTEIRQLLHERGGHQDKLDFTLLLGQDMLTKPIRVPRHLSGRIIGRDGLIVNCIKKRCGVEIRSPPKEVLMESEMSDAGTPNFTWKNGGNSSNNSLTRTVTFQVSAFSQRYHDNTAALNRIRQAMQLMSVFMAWPTHHQMRCSHICLAAVENSQQNSCCSREERRIYEKNLLEWSHLWCGDFPMESYDSAREIIASVHAEINRHLLTAIADNTSSLHPHGDPQMRPRRLSRQELIPSPPFTLPRGKQVLPSCWDDGRTPEANVALSSSLRNILPQRNPSHNTSTTRYPISTTSASQQQELESLSLSKLLISPAKQMLVNRVSPPESGYASAHFNPTPGVRSRKDSLTSSNQVRPLHQLCGPMSPHQEMSDATRTAENEMLLWSWRQLQPAMHASLY